MQSGFWMYVRLFGLVQTLGTLNLLKALKLSDISIVTPLWKLSLLILLGFAFLTLGETPSPLGLLGILVSLFGVYLLNIQKTRRSVWAPLGERFTERGLRYTLVSVLFYALAVVSSSKSWCILIPTMPI